MTERATQAVVRACSRPSLPAHVRLSFDAVRGGTVLLGPEAVVVLNGSGAAILDLCDGLHTVAEIAEELRGHYDRVDIDAVLGFLTRLAGRRYLDVPDD